MRLKDKVAIVTGGTSGIGKGSCLMFAQQGAKVVVVGQNEDRGLDVVKQIQAEGGEAIFCQVDVSKADQVQGMIKKTIERFGKIDILFNNAFWYKVAPALELTDEDWYRTLDVTLSGTYLCCKYAIKEMIHTGGGSIINNASVGAVVGFAAHPAYNASKGGIIALTKNLAIDYGAHQIRVNAISPGIIETENTEKDVHDPDKHRYFMTKCLTQRIGTPEDVAYMAVYLASDESTFVTGANFMVDNGWTAI